MKWHTPETWDALKQGQGCAFCTGLLDEANPFSFLVAELEHNVVRLPRNQFMRGWTVVIFKRHANELFELSSAERAGFWDEVSAVAQALQALHAPAKINYCIWGNLTPHLHCHLFPRTFADDPAKPIDQNEREMLLPTEEYRSMIGQLKSRITAGRHGNEPA
jgi:diadenosine tetraphosphate (Ap4A) HIT family hydrolase